MSLLTDFKQAQLDIRQNRTVIVGHAKRLELHGLYAQAVRGDNNDPKPSTANVIGFQKWLEHSKHKGKSKEDAMTLYIEAVRNILKKKVSTAPILPPLQYPPKTRLSAFRSKRNVAKKPQPKVENKREKAVVQESDRTSKFSISQEIGRTTTTSVESLGFPSVLQSDVSRSRRHASATKERQKKNKRTEPSKLVEAQVSASSLLTVDDSQPNLPPLPPIDKPTVAKQHEATRQQLFRSRHFSSILGTVNPLNDKENLEEKFMLYEKIRAFYEVHDPERIKRGLGNIVEWTLTHGEDKLNENLRKKYNTDLNEFEQKNTQKEAAKRRQQKAKTRSQLALSQRLVHTKDVVTRKKMDKLTRFLLVNDPELVSHGMYLMMKFIENKGLGALNENLKKNYGKSLDSVSEEELNEELKKKYGNDLGMLDKPLFGSRKSIADDQTVNDEPLQDQILNIDQDRLKQKASRRSTVDQRAPPPSNKFSNARTTQTSFDERAYMETLPGAGKNIPFFQEYLDNKELLQSFLEVYEPYRFDEAFELIGNYLKRYGLKEVNRKLRKKYDVDLNTFQNMDMTNVDGDMSETEFNVRVLQFVTKHEKPKNIERAIQAMTAYKRKQGLAALNTKLFMKYGETLNDIEEEESTREEKGMSMAELHKLELPQELKEKLKIYYAKYDPTILGSRGIDRIFHWAEVNGTAALDRQLKAKYKESLTEFIKEYGILKKELTEFYTKVDKRKLESEQLETVLSWAIVNGRDALNYNLRKKYDRDLQSATQSIQSTLSSDKSPDL